MQMPNLNMKSFKAIATTPAFPTQILSLLAK